MKITELITKKNENKKQQNIKLFKNIIQSIKKNKKISKQPTLKPNTT